jgi:hypothetical protein
VTKLIGFSEDILSKSTFFSIVSESDLSKVFALTNRVLSGDAVSEMININLVHAQGLTVSVRSFITAITHSPESINNNLGFTIESPSPSSHPSSSSGKVVALLVLFSASSESATLDTSSNNSVLKA